MFVLLKMLQYHGFQALGFLCISLTSLGLYFLFVYKNTEYPLLTLALWVSTIFLLQRRIARGRTCAEVNTTGRMRGKTVIVTGGNSGLGLETSRSLYRMGAHVIMACRDPRRAQRAADDIRRASVSDGGQLTLLSLDLASRKSIEVFAGDLMKREGFRLDILVNNAGIADAPYGHTEDGWETLFGTNHMGTYYLTHLLLPLLLASKGRVVNVGSAGMILFLPLQNAHTLDLASIAKVESESHYHSRRQYAYSKLCNAIHAQELQKCYGDRGLTAVCVHPGNVISPMSLGFNRRLFAVSDSVNALMAKTILPLVCQTAVEGAQTTLHCCLHDVVGGGYYADCMLMPGHVPHVTFIGPRGERGLTLSELTNSLWKLQ